MKRFKCGDIVKFSKSSKNPKFYLVHDFLHGGTHVSAYLCNYLGKRLAHYTMELYVPHLQKNKLCVS